MLGFLVSSIANHVGTCFPLRQSGSQKLVTGTRQRCSRFSQGFQKLLVVFRTLVVTGDLEVGGDGKPHRILSNSRPVAVFRTMGAI